MEMKSLISKFEKSAERVEKTYKSIANAERQAEKKLAEIHKNGWTTNLDMYRAENDTTGGKAYWAICKYQDKLSDIKRLKKQAIEYERIMNDWKQKLESAKKECQALDDELPDVLKQMVKQLADIWVECDKNRIIELREIKHNDSKKFYRLHYAEWERINKSEPELLKMETESATKWVLDLYYRIKEKTGNVKSWKNIRFDVKALNGIVEGDNGSVRIRTIEAGGYNIQRFHYRVIVTELKD